MNIFVGTSGYTYPCWHAPGVFYSENIKKHSKKKLAEYAKTFNSVEINTTFYGHPTEKTVLSWLDQVKEYPDFKFVIKVNKYMTHSKKLCGDIREMWERFWSPINLIFQADKLGCLLFQFPAVFKCNEQNIEKLKELSEIVPSQITCAFEFRNQGWYDSRDVFDLFIDVPSWVLATPYVVNNRENWSSDLIETFTNREIKMQTIITNDIIYLRFHGTTGMYTGSYDFDNFLERLIEDLINKHITFGITQIFCMFNNTDSTYAMSGRIVCETPFGILRERVPLPPGVTVDRPAVLHDALKLTRLWKNYI